MFAEVAAPTPTASNPAPAPQPRYEGKPLANGSGYRVFDHHNESRIARVAGHPAAVEALVRRLNMNAAMPEAN